MKTDRQMEQLKKVGGGGHATGTNFRQQPGDAKTAAEEGTTTKLKKSHAENKDWWATTETRAKCRAFLLPTVMPRLLL